MHPTTIKPGDWRLALVGGECHGVEVRRHYRDTAPTAGTLYSSAGEHLTVAVDVTAVG